MDKPTIKSERRILKDYGATPHPRSGRGHFLKADGSDSQFVWDVKEAEKSFRLTQDVWKKICSDAYHTDPYKDPGLIIVLGGKTELVLIEAMVLKHLRQDIEGLRSEIDHLRRHQGTERPE